MITKDFFTERRRRLFIAGFVNAGNEYPERVPYQLSIYTIIKGKIKERIEKKENLPSVYICGALQTGKTSLMKLISDLYADVGQDVLYTTTDAYMSNYDKRNGSWVEKEDSRNFMDKCKNINILLLDNLSWSFDTDYQFRTIIELIRYRYDRKLPMVLCSNVDLSKKKNKNQYEEQLVAYLSPEKNYYLNFIYDNKKQLNDDNLKSFDPKYSVLNELSFANIPVVNLNTGNRTKAQSKEYRRRGYVLSALLLDKTIKLDDMINYTVPGKNDIDIGCTDIEKTYEKLITSNKIILSKTQMSRVAEFAHENK